MKFPPASIFDVLRFAHLSKNFLVFIPLLASHNYSVDAFLSTGMGFVCFCLISSASYLINDLMDLPFDRVHPWKKLRPLVSGTISPFQAVSFAGGLVTAGFLLAFSWHALEFLIALFAYFALALLYSLRLKRLPVFDIVTLVGLFTLRLVGGSVASSQDLSTWLFAFSLFIFCSLAAVKRVAELVNGLKLGREHVPGRAYERSDIGLLTGVSISSGYLAILTCILYVNSSKVSQLYAHPEILWGVSVVLLFWISRIVFLASRGEMIDDPVVFSIRDATSLVCGLVVCCLLLAAKFPGMTLI